MVFEGGDQGVRVAPFLSSVDLPIHLSQNSWEAIDERCS